MPQIQFDVLVPADRAEALKERFADAGEKLAAAGVLDAMPVESTQARLQVGVADQLRQTYRDQHQGRDLENAEVLCYLLRPEGFSGSVNQLTMALSRLLTPAAELPDDPVLLENETAHELPAVYPWTVEIFR